MIELMSMLKGYKTYIVCAVAIIYAITGIVSGHLDTSTAFNVILAALGAAGLRNAIPSQS